MEANKKIIRLFGRSGAGKTTLAAKLVDRYKAMGVLCSRPDGEKNVQTQKKFKKHVKLEHVGNLRFLTVLLIVCNHLSFNLFNVDETGEPRFKLWFEFTTPILALLSGWLFFYNTKDNNFSSKVKNRFFSLVVPYVLWTLIYVATHFILKNGYYYFTGTVIWDYPLPSWSWGYMFDAVWRKPIVVNFWYIQNLLLIIPFNWVLFQLSKISLFIDLFCLLILAASLFKVNLFFPDRFIYFYLVGCYLGIKQVGFNGFYWKNLPVTVGFLLVSVVLEWGLRSFNCCYLLNISIIFLVCLHLLGILRRHSESKVVKLLKRWEDHAFFIFAAHSIVISALGKIFILLLGKHPGIHPVFCLTLLFVQLVVSVLICTALSVFIRRTQFRVWSILVGGRT